MIIEYGIAEHRSPAINDCFAGVVDEVKRLSLDGWVPLGGLQVVVVPGIGTTLHSYLVAQALVREER